jgi:hypothetical protein
MSAEKQTRRCAARVGKLLDLRPAVADNARRMSGQLSLRSCAGGLNFGTLAPHFCKRSRFVKTDVFAVNADEQNQ